MASDPVPTREVTLSDGQVTLEGMPTDGGARAAGYRWRATRLSTRAELGDLRLTVDADAVRAARARLEVTVNSGADTGTIHGLAQGVRLACTWAFGALGLAVISWLGPRDATTRAVVNQAGFRVHPFPHRGALDAPDGPVDAWYADLTPDDSLTPNRRPLTAREHHVLTALTRGRSNQQIALDLGISENTVKNHVRSILEVLQAPSRTAAVIEGLRTGLVSLTFDAH
ncbi:MAG: helix-turn-helix domain-containing protein [Candidatus Nanopelagicales bacterium]